MSTIREQLVASAVAALTTGRPAGVPAPVRTRIDSPTAEQLPALTVYQAAETVEPMRDPRAGGRPTRGAVVRRSVVIHVEVLTKAGADAGDEPDKAADPILAWSTKAMASLGRCDGLAHHPPDELGTQFAYEQRETAFCRATMAFQIKYQSLIDDAESVT